MAQAVAELAEQGSPAFDAALPLLAQLLKAEIAEREVRSIAYQIKAARFPTYKDLAGYDFAVGEADEALIRQLHRGQFIEDAQNVVLIGGPGTGKTQVSRARPGLGPQGRRRSSGFDTVIAGRIRLPACPEPGHSVGVNRTGSGRRP